MIGAIFSGFVAATLSVTPVALQAEDSPSLLSEGTKSAFDELPNSAACSAYGELGGAIMGAWQSGAPREAMIQTASGVDPILREFVILLANDAMERPQHESGSNQDNEILSFAGVVEQYCNESRGRDSEGSTAEAAVEG